MDQMRSTKTKFDPAIDNKLTATSRYGAKPEFSNTFGNF